MITYCVICRESRLNLTHNQDVIRFYIRSATADLAILATEVENPEYRVLGIEPVTRNGSQAA